MVAVPMVLLIGALGFVSHTQSQHWSSAFALNRHAVDVTPDNPFMLVYLGAELAERGDEIGAIKVYQRAMDVHPGYALAHIGLGELHTQRGDRAQALVHYREAVEFAPHHKGFRFQLATALARSGNLGEAIEAYEAVSADRSRNIGDPAPSDVHFMLGNAYHDNGSVGKAVYHYRKALRLSPDRSAEFQYWIDRAEREQRRATLPPRFAVRQSSEPASTPPTGF
jgi:tetratricopeptide (TPR) repeat protein